MISKPDELPPLTQTQPKSLPLRSAKEMRSRKRTVVVPADAHPLVGIRVHAGLEGGGGQRKPGACVRIKVDRAHFHEITSVKRRRVRRETDDAASSSHECLAVLALVDAVCLCVGLGRKERPAVVSDSCNSTGSLATPRPAYNSAQEASCLACLLSRLSLSSSLSITRTHKTLLRDEFVPTAQR